MCHVSCVGLKCKNICISKYEIWRINMHNQDVNYLLIHQDQANDYITAMNGYRIPMAYKKQELSSCVFTVCFHNIFLIWLSIDMIVHWYLLEFRISYFWYLSFCAVVVISRSFVRLLICRRNIGSSHNHSKDGWTLDLKCLAIKKHQIIRETCCEFVFRRFLNTFLESLSIPITIWVLTNHFCLNHESFGHL